MRAVAACDGRLRLVDIPRPEPAAGEILVKVLACGICGSDLHFLKFGADMVRASVESGFGRFALDLTRDIVMGHEFCCEVVAYGPDTDAKVPIGGRVTSIPPHGAFNNDYSGGYAEYMLLNANLALPLPDSVSTEQAAMTEPMAVGLHSARAARISGAEPAVVYGCGPAGLAVIAHLKAEGCGTIVASDLSAARRKLALTMGADIAVNPREISPITMLQRQSSYQRGDEIVMFDAIGTPGSIALLMKEAPASGARIIVVGVCMQNDEIVPVAGIEKELQLKFVLAYTRGEFAETLGAIGGGTIDPTPMISGRVGLGGVAGAFETLASPEEHCKIMVTPHDR